MSKTPRAQRGTARVHVPQRNQIEIRMLSLDQMLEPEHRVRQIWAYAQACDLTLLYQRIQAVEGTVGRNAVDPRLLFALWLYATIERVSSARRLEALCTRDLPYQWLCGGVSVNYHLLSDFRAMNGELLEQLMVDSVAVLLHQELITLDTVAQDGMKVRAHAGSSSFQKQQTLKQAYDVAALHLEELKKQHEADPSGEDRRSKAAQKRAAEERERRLAQAQEELKKLEENRKKQRGKRGSVARASTTDPEARRMKTGDGGFRPCFNVQFATEGEARIIVGVHVTNQGTDSGLMEPMFTALHDTYDRQPKVGIVDGGFAKKEDITTLTQHGTLVYSPIPREEKQRAAGKDPCARKPGDSDEMAAFRVRMGTPEARAIYKIRGGIAEFPNAECRNRGLLQFKVRGLKKVKAQTLWHVLAFNFQRFLNLGFLETVMSGPRTV